MGNSKPTLRILHTADIHLGDELRPDTARDAFVAVIEHALADKPDLMIIAGDLFDSKSAARNQLDFALSELARLPIPVVLLPGNHDPYDEHSVYREVDIPRHCSHVHLIRAAEGEYLHFPKLRLTLWGKPVVDHSPDFRPLENIPPREGDNWHVAVAHGFHVPDGQSSSRSSTITGRAIAETGWDYVALGHVHPYRDVSQGGVAAYYSGSPNSTWTADGIAGYVVSVELDAQRGVNVRPVMLESQR